MYDTFIERTDGLQSKGRIDLWRSNPAFAAICFILLLCFIGAFYGFLLPGDRYVNESKFREEYRNPPTLRSYLLVKKGALQRQLKLDINPSRQLGAPRNEKVEKWKPQPTAYQPQSDDIVLRDINGQPIIFPLHLFGTDSQGRDVFIRTLVSLRVYLLPSLMAIGLSVFFGTLLGILGADIWTGQLMKMLQFLAQCLLDVLEALPKYITILLAVILIPPEHRHFQWHGITWYGFYWLSIILGWLSVPKLGKLIMERIDLLKKREFIEAAEAMGMSKFKVAFKHVLRYNCLPLFLTQAAVLMTDVILTEIVLSYLTDGTEWGRGITVAEPNPSWGNILVNGRYYLFNSWWLNFFPLLIVLLWITASYMFARGVNQIFAQQRASTEL